MNELTRHDERLPDRMSKTTQTHPKNISRAEMREILAAMPGLADASTINGRFADGSLLAGKIHVPPRARGRPGHAAVDARH